MRVIGAIAAEFAQLCEAQGWRQNDQFIMYHRVPPPV